VWIIIVGNIKRLVGIMKDFVSSKIVIPLLPEEGTKGWRERHLT